MANKYDNMTLDQLVKLKDKASKSQVTGAIMTGIGAIGTGIHASKPNYTTPDGRNNMFRNTRFMKNKNYVDNISNVGAPPVDSKTAKKYRAENRSILANEMIKPLGHSPEIFTSIGGIDLIANTIKKNRINNAINRKLRSKDNSWVGDTFGTLTGSVKHKISEINKDTVGKYAYTPISKGTRLIAPRHLSTEDLLHKKRIDDLISATKKKNAESTQKEWSKLMSLYLDKQESSADNSADDSFESIM